MPVTIPGAPGKPPRRRPGERNVDREQLKRPGERKAEREQHEFVSVPKARVTCLIIAPFDSAGARVKDTIERAMDEIGVAVLSLENLRPGAAWVNAVTDAIKFSDFIIVDISRHNPNVMYELGYAHALRKPTILLMGLDAKSPPPSDLEGVFYITYDPENLRSLKDDVLHSASRYTRSGGKK